MDMDLSAWPFSFHLQGIKNMALLQWRDQSIFFLKSVEWHLQVPCSSSACLLGKLEYHQKSGQNRSVLLLNHQNLQWQYVPGLRNSHKMEEDKYWDLQMKEILVITLKLESIIYSTLPPPQLLEVCNSVLLSIHNSKSDTVQCTRIIDTQIIALENNSAFSQYDQGWVTVIESKFTKQSECSVSMNVKHSSSSSPNHPNSPHVSRPFPFHDIPLGVSLVKLHYHQYLRHGNSKRYMIEAILGQTQNFLWLQQLNHCQVQ